MTLISSIMKDFIEISFQKNLKIRDTIGIARLNGAFQVKKANKSALTLGQSIKFEGLFSLCPLIKDLNVFCINKNFMAPAACQLFYNAHFL